MNHYFGLLRELNVLLTFSILKTFLMEVKKPPHLNGSFTMVKNKAFDKSVLIRTLNFDWNSEFTLDAGR